MHKHWKFAIYSFRFSIVSLFVRNLIRFQSYWANFACALLLISVCLSLPLCSSLCLSPSLSTFLIAFAFSIELMPHITFSACLTQQSNHMFSLPLSPILSHSLVSLFHFPCSNINFHFNSISSHPNKDTTRQRRDPREKKIAGIKGGSKAEKLIKKQQQKNVHASLLLSLSLTLYFSSPLPPSPLLRWYFVLTLKRLIFRCFITGISRVRVFAKRLSTFIFVCCFCFAFCLVFLSSSSLSLTLFVLFIHLPHSMLLLSFRVSLLLHHFCVTTTTIKNKTKLFKYFSLSYTV